MLKRLSVALAALFVLSTAAFGAGTIPYSLSQQLDELGKPLSGCKLYTIQAGTTSTPQNSYQDSALSIVNPNPLICDASGRLPQFFLADGSIKVRLTKSSGANVVTADGILVVGASSGGGGGSPVDATTVLATGDLKPRYGVGVLAGFVRANGRTIGNASSGATERANADTSALFTYLYLADANLAVSGGRGASAAADYAANKTIDLPDWRGRTLAFLDDMGNSAAGRLTASYFGTVATVLGAAGGLETHTLTTAQIPSHSHTGSTGIESADHTHAQQGSFTTGNESADHFHLYDKPVAGSQKPNGTGTTPYDGTTPTLTGGASAHHTHSVTISGQTGTVSAHHLHQFTTDAAGGGNPHNNTQPTMLATIYIKL